MALGLRIVAVAALVAMTGLSPQGAGAQGVDRYDFNQLRDRVKTAETELGRIRNAISGGDFLARFEQLSGEITRLTAELEQLEFRVRKMEENSKRKLEDLEYRIIELEGGDPSVLFSSNDEPDDPPPTPAPQGGGNTLGNLTVDSSGAAVTPRASADVNASVSERAAYDAAVSAAMAGQTSEAVRLLKSFVRSFPDSGLAGDAYYQLGESYIRAGNSQKAAGSFLDAATLYPNSPVAPQSLVRLGVALSLMGQRDVACSTFREVGQRYPAAATSISQASLEAQRAGCP